LDFRFWIDVETRVLTAEGDFAAAVEAACAVLRAGEPVALPTETVYGLAADALNARACARIFEAKERPLEDPLIVHLPDLEWLDGLAWPGEAALRLVERFWPGPLTLVLPRREIVPDIVTAGRDTVAVRMSAHPVFRAVAGEFGGPLAAPSANKFGRISPTTAEAVRKELGGAISLIVDGGQCRHGIESTIVRVEGERLRILRHGPVTAEELREFGEIIEGPVAGVATPGGLKSHYAPRTRMAVAEDAETRGLGDAGTGGIAAASREEIVGRLGQASLPQASRPIGRIGLLAWGHSGEGFDCVEHLSRRRDLLEAAANLYAAMRRLDEAGLDLIIAEPVPETGLGIAIMERLRKASAGE
jgi:L-threonylcarbamoyladenylate synthase